MSDILNPSCLDFIRLELTLLRNQCGTAPIMTVYFGNIKEPILKMPHELRKAILKPTLFPRSLLNVRLCSKEKYTGIKHTEGCSSAKYF